MALKTKVTQAVLNKFKNAIQDEAKIQVFGFAVNYEWCNFSLQSMNCDEIIAFGQFIKRYFSEDGNFVHRLPKLDSNKFIISSKQLMLVWKDL